MAVDLRVPKLGAAVSEGTLLEWIATDGATVTEGQPIYTIGTDKVDSEIEAPASGVLRCIGAIGATYPVGELIGSIEQ